MEQVSIQLILFSCAYKSNVFSIFYLGLLLCMILRSNKQEGMRFTLICLVASVGLSYLVTLTNLTSANSPMTFPRSYLTFPCEKLPECPLTTFTFPLFMHSELLRNQLDLVLYLGINVQSFKVNDMWFDLANILLITVYFYKFGSQSRIMNNVKVSFSKS
jgi:hypothetical protein